MHMKLLTDWFSLNFSVPCATVKFMWKFPSPHRDPSPGDRCVSEIIHKPHLKDYMKFPRVLFLQYIFDSQKSFTQRLLLTFEY